LNHLHPAFASLWWAQAAALGWPYSKSTPAEKLFSPETSVGHLVTVLDNVCREDSGVVFAWDGKRIEN